MTYLEDSNLNRCYQTEQVFVRNSRKEKFSKKWADRPIDLVWPIIMLPRLFQIRETSIRHEKKNEKRRHHDMWISVALNCAFKKSRVKGSGFKGCLQYLIHRTLDLNGP